jgi:hypothetical protein
LKKRPRWAHLEGDGGEGNSAIVSLLLLVLLLFSSCCPSIPMYEFWVLKDRRDRKRYYREDILVKKTYQVFKWVKLRLLRIQQKPTGMSANSLVSRELRERERVRRKIQDGEKVSKTHLVLTFFN